MAEKREVCSNYEFQLPHRHMQTFEAGSDMQKPTLRTLGFPSDVFCSLSPAPSTMVLCRKSSACHSATHRDQKSLKLRL